MYCLFFFFLLLTQGSVFGMSSYPYISGDTFRSIAHHIFDETQRTFNSALVKDRQIVFVKTDFIEEFFTKYHPLISGKYILITHNSDYGIPGRCERFLDDPKLMAWFGQNVTKSHPKLTPIPIGLPNIRLAGAQFDTLKKIQSKVVGLNSKDVQNLLYMNINIHNNRLERQKVFDLFKEKKYCKNASRKSFEEYLKEMARYCFVLSPEGNGVDCIRTWEALLIGCIPVVKSNELDPMYQDLPVLIVEHWEDINEKFLLDAYHGMKEKNYNFKKLYADYWFEKIRAVQQATDVL